MQFHHAGYRIKGFYRLADYALRWGMASSEASRRLKILAFWERHGLAATMEAFEVSRRTLYGWRKRYREGAGQPASLEAASRAPRHRRRRLWPAAVIAEIKRLRRVHPNLGAAKLHPALVRFCAERGWPCPSVRTIARLIADQPGGLRRRPQRAGRNRTPVRRTKRVHKPSAFRATYPGHCVALDTIERFHEGMRRYVISFTDLDSHFGFALATSSHTSQAAAGFFELARTAFPVPIHTVLTDNGSEFACEFAQALGAQGLAHWHIWPRTPKMNAHAERFNRTLQEEFIDYHEALLFTDLLAFNDKLLDYLLWFNDERPHYSLDQHPPIWCLIRASPQCNMCWPHPNNRD